MIDIKILNNAEELSSFPVNQSIILEVSENLPLHLLQRYISLYRVLKDDSNINLSPPYAYNLGYIKEKYGEEELDFKFENGRILLKTKNTLKVSSTYLLYISDNLFSSGVTVTKTKSKSARSNLTVEVINPNDLVRNLIVNITSTSKITSNSNDIEFSINNGSKNKINLKNNNVFEYNNLRFKFIDTLYLEGEEFTIDVKESTVSGEELVYKITTAPFNTIREVEVDPPKTIDTNVILDFYKKAESINKENNIVVPQYVHINSYTIPKPEGYTLDLNSNVLFSIKEAFKDYTLNNLNLYDPTKKYKITIIEEEEVFIIDVIEDKDLESNVIVDVEDNIIVSTEKRVL